MSAAAQTASLPRTPSTRQQSAYNTPSDRERPHRTQSTTSRSAAPPSPRRTVSTSQAAAAATQSRTVSNHYEQSNAARPNSSRRSESHDRSMNGASSARSESMKQSTSHSRTQSRYAEQPTPAPANGNHQTEGSRSTATGGTSNLRRRTTVDAQTGHWDLGKTIGAGSMGKVKLARNKETGEQVAVKIVPRQSNDGEYRTQAERDRADHSKEVRTAREAAIVTLVDHPYICGMRDVVRTNYHWYMLFEYVNGGQMLDYIISHGRLKEKQARKFGRQIASALDYSHRNSIVHRDLKIENILISKNGDIKIIDFGLSNLFSPRGHLKTFCGSLYFAAPELLQAKQYTGPEVDVWSFGIVLYVLVCGKVPFDDQSMPQLHAKIKRGNVEYPPWLSPECKGLISRMLTTNPPDRATMQDILTHPWITKGYNGPPENYLPLRKPLQLPLDPNVVAKMTGFDFGSEEIITSQLTKVLESEDYQRAVRAAERRMAQQPEQEQKRGVFNFYKRRNSTTSKDTLSTPSSEAVQTGTDPINAFHPLISVYYLASEKIEREAREINPGGLAMPQSPGEKPLKVPDLPAPEPAYTNSQAYEMAGEKPTGGRTRPRARTHGEDEVQDGMRNLNVNTAPSPTNPTIVEPGAGQQPPAPQRRESGAVGLLRRLSTRRSKEPTADRAARGERPSHPPPSLAAYGQSETPKKSFSVRRTRDRDSSVTRQAPASEAAPAGQGRMLSPPGTGDASSEKSSRIHGLGRSISVNSSDMRKRFTRRGVSEGGPMRPPMTSSGSRDGRKPSMDRSGPARDAGSDVETPRPGTSGLASRTKSVGHARRESMQTRRTKRGDATRAADVPEETDRDVQEEMDGANAGNASPTGFKPVYLKGFFSSSTTSSKPGNFIRGDIVRVLNQLGVEWIEIKGGFRCRHAPSIKAGADGESTPPMNPPLNEPTPQKRKISFGSFRNNADRDALRAQTQQPPTPRGKSTSARDTYATQTDDSASDDENGRPTSSNAQQARVAGETSTHVQTDLGDSMVLKFEIFVVKVPLIGLHGVQFKKIEGGTWQYKNLAQRILDDLRL